MSDVWLERALPVLREAQTGIPEAPRVRAVQRSQLRAALPWVIRARDLPPIDGTAATL